MKEQTLKEKLARLNEINILIDNPELDLEKAIELYSESVLLAESCRKQLEEAKQKITTLSLKED